MEYVRILDKKSSEKYKKWLVISMFKKTLDADRTVIQCLVQ